MASHVGQTHATGRAGAPLARDEQGAACVERVEAALDALDVLEARDPGAAEAALECVQAVLEMYGEGLGRVVALVGPDGARALADDELVAHLLLLHGLHPVPLAERVEEALADVRSYLASHGGGAELVAVEDGVAHVRLQGTCDGCPSSTVTLQHAVEEAVRRAAPEVERVEAAGAMPAPPVGVSPFGALPMAHGGAGPAARDGSGGLPMAGEGPACPAATREAGR
jgi:Fe-S cluster biogenesis protein NfuA